MFRLSIVTACALGMTLLALYEMRTSNLQAAVFSVINRGVAWEVAPGPASAPLSPPEDGPYDARLGYSRLATFVPRVESAGYAIEAQARPSPRMQALGKWGLYAPYGEKDQAGLRVTDRLGRPLHEVRFPERAYESFEAIPLPVVSMLLFIENRELLDGRHPRVNPAVEWPRLAKALGLDVLSRLGRQGQVIGASTLATQIEKFRHAQEGRTRSAGEKLRQMMSASLRAYRDGADTLPARRRIVIDYLNSLPLAATPGRGEVLGLGDGLAAWYGVEFSDVNRRLRDGAAADDPARAQAYKRVLSLILATRRPYYYLTENRAALEEFTNSYLRVMVRAGVIDPSLRDAALGQPVAFRMVSPMPASDWSERKGANFVRARLTSMLGVPALYDLDRLDLSAQSTLDAPSQEAVSRLLQSLRDPATVQALGLKGLHLLERGDPSRVVYSFTLYERGPRANLIRVQTDSFDQPLDINAGARLDLGSTAKLRTLITYLELIAAIHARYARVEPAELRTLVIHPKDRLTAWTTEFLAAKPGAGLAATLEAAMERRFSANPGEPFVTGSGLQSFHNFNKDDDARILTVREAFRHSVNLVFIRLMRDVVDHHLYAAPASLARVLEDPDDPRRHDYLMRFADREGSEFIRRFYRKYADKTPEQTLELALSGARQTPRALAIVLRSIAPDASVERFQAILASRLPGERLSEDIQQDVYDAASPARFSLMDRGYLARVHPLELWLVAYLAGHPGVDLAQVLEQSRDERQEVYGWLFKTHRRHAQDKRIRSLLEVQAFLEIQRDWQRLGYPFASVTPSLASAIGSSGDRPAALAKLMGIVVNDGISYPTVLLERLEFATGTPYETKLRRADAAGERLLPTEIAQLVRRALVDVVEQGTAQGLRQALTRADGGGKHVVGGKTGTGDHRYETYAPGGRLIESRAVERAATFVFTIDERFFGTVTAYVAGRQAAQYEFTSALPVRVLGLLMPALSPLIADQSGGQRAALLPDTPQRLAAASSR